MARVVNQQQAMVAMAALVIALRLFKGRSSGAARQPVAQDRGVADLQNYDRDVLAMINAKISDLERRLGVLNRRDWSPVFFDNFKLAELVGIKDVGIMYKDELRTYVNEFTDEGMTKPYDITQALVRIKLGVPDLFDAWHPIYVDRFEGLYISTLAELNAFITYSAEPLAPGAPAPTKTLEELAEANFNVAYFETNPKVTPAKYDYGLIVREENGVNFSLYVVRGTDGQNDIITQANLSTSLQDISVGEIDADDLVQLTWSNAEKKWQYIISSGEPGVPDENGFVPAPVPNVRDIVFIT